MSDMLLIAWCLMPTIESLGTSPNADECNLHTSFPKFKLDILRYFL